MDIVEKREATEKEWMDHWENCDYATYFQSPMWGELWEKYSGGGTRAKAELLKFSDGNYCVLPFGAVRILRGLGTNKLFSQGGTFGGPISKYNLNDEHYKKIVDLLSSFPSIIIRDNPYNSILTGSQAWTKREDYTHNISLGQNQDHFSNWSSSHKRAVKKAVKEGVVTKVADSSEEWDQYFRIYEKSLIRWGEKASSQYSKTLFNMLEKLPGVKLWISLVDGQVASGAIILYSRKIAIYWHGASDESFYNKRPVNLLFKDVLDDTARNNYQYFDFNPSGGHEGVERFKKGFGCEMSQCDVYVGSKWTHSFLEKLSSTVRNWLK